jgi:hypothetical protein
MLSFFPDFMLIGCDCITDLLIASLPLCYLCAIQGYVVHNVICVCMLVFVILIVILE